MNHILENSQQLIGLISGILGAIATFLTTIIGIIIKGINDNKKTRAKMSEEIVKLQNHIKILANAFNEYVQADSNNEATKLHVQRLVANINLKEYEPTL